MDAFMAIFVFFSLAASTKGDDECNKWDPISVTLPELARIWYPTAFINVTNLAEKRACIKLIYSYNPENDTITETDTGIPYGSDQVATNINPIFMYTPGELSNIITVDNTKYYYHDYVLEYTKGESLITAYCEIINGTKYTDMITLLMATPHANYETIMSKFNSIGIYTEDIGEYYRIPQNNCPNFN